MHRATALLALAALSLFLAGNFFLFLKSDFDVRTILPQPRHHRGDETLHAIQEKNCALEVALSAAHAEFLNQTARPSELFAAIADPPPQPGEPAGQAAEEEAPKSNRNRGYAYVFYATSAPCACSALVNIRRLRLLGSTVQFHILVPHPYPQPTSQPSQPKMQPGGYYADCFLKLLAFKLHLLAPGLKRVLALDADQLVVRNLDGVFEGVPSVDLVAPRAYWFPPDAEGGRSKGAFTSTFLLVELGDAVWKKVEGELAALAGSPDPVPAAVAPLAVTVGSGSAVETRKIMVRRKPEEWDMDVLNRVFGQTVLLLPVSFACLNSHWEDWNLPLRFRGKERKRVNETTVELVNAAARPRMGDRRLRRKIGERNADEDFETPVPEDVGSTQPPIQPLPLPVAVPLLQQLAPPSAQPLAPPPQLPPPPAIFPPPNPDPRFPASHPMTLALSALYNSLDDSIDSTTSTSPGPASEREHSSAQIIHFTALGKPWTLSADTVKTMRPDAHPGLAKLVGVWWEDAGEVCPDMDTPG